MLRTIILVSTITLFLSNPLLADNLKKRKQVIADQLYEIMVEGGDFLGYSKEILRHLSKVDKIVPGKIKKDPSDYRKRWYRRRGRRNETIDAFSLLSGGLAIRESLQLESIGRSADDVREIDISTLQGPLVKSHPFKDMLRGRKFKIFSLAEYCPENFYYFHFNNMEKSLKFFDYLGSVGGSLHKRISPQSVDFMLKEKILTQLAIRENKNNRKFYNYIIKEMALVGSDPFIKEGTDVTILYRIKIKSIFDHKILSFRKYFKKKFKAKWRKIKILGKKTDYLFTSDRKINSYLVTLKDGTVIISNSRKAVERIIQVFRKKIKRLSDAHDFQYMRSIYPADEKTEDAFLYLSDSFIRRLVGPELRIKEARRVNEAIRLSTLEKYILYHYQLFRKLPASMDDIYRLNKEANDQSKGGIQIFKGLRVNKNSFSASSSTYGKNGFFKSNLEIDIKKITSDEAEKYKRFVKEYNDFWKDFFDPIGVRIKMDKGISVDTCILPLINNSMYNMLTAFIGGKPVKLNPHNNIKGEIFSLALKLRKQMIKSSGMINTSDLKFANFLLSDNFKDEVQVHMLDGEPLVDFDGKYLISSMIRRHKNFYFVAGLMGWSFFHPMRISLPLSKPDAGKEVLMGMEKLVKDLSKEYRYDRYINIDNYSYKNKNRRLNIIKITFFKSIKYRIYYSVINNRLEITSTKGYMEKLLNKENYLKRVKTGSNTGNIIAAFRPNQVVLERDLSELNILESVAKLNYKNFGTIKLLGTIFKGTNNIGQKSFDLFGFKPVCPMGGEYYFDRKTGTVRSSIFGTPDKPVIRYEKIKSHMIKRYFGTEEIKVELEFTKEGIKTRIFTR